MSRADRRKWRAMTRAKFPHVVDLVSPPDGAAFSKELENEIVRFLEPLKGTFDLMSDLIEGEPVARYCFMRSVDAVEFRQRFVTGGH